MADFKYTVDFDYVNEPQTAVDKTRHSGWTENLYHPTLSEGVGSNFFAWMAARAQLLAKNCLIVGYRIADLAAPGTSLTRGYRVLGTQDAQDLPQVAIFWWMQTTQGNRLKLEVRGVPDVQISNGAFKPINGYDFKFLALAAATKDFYQPARNVTAPRVSIDNITAAGIVTLTADLAGTANGVYVRVLRSVTSQHRQIGGKFRIKDFVDAQHFTLEGWDTKVNLATTMGKMRVDGVVKATYTGAVLSPGEATIRDTGGPIFRSRGRRSTRR